MSKVMIVVGNPSRNSRTRRAAEVLVGHLMDPAATEVEVVELADYADELFGGNSEHLAAAVGAVSSSDLVVFASPTYKAGYTGLLKSFLDHFAGDGLTGVVALPLQTGATEGHSMVATHILGPQLSELGALVPGPGFYLPMTAIEQLEDRAKEAALRFRSNLRRARSLAEALTRD